MIYLLADGTETTKQEIQEAQGRALKITTNNKPRWLETWHNLPQKEQEYFDYLEADQKHEQRFAHYRGEWYDAIDTQSITTGSTSLMGWALHVEATSPLAKWHAIAADSLFSGLVFRFTEDGDVVVGRYTL